ncbi:MAG: hypothetical protein HKP58_01175 [Desulfatitalea sp.]|nr:hypothetical protein [Desulfatitalea sp.]NNJ98998.1 hypothetical protein [Desulfatitalea sp.]
MVKTIKPAMAIVTAFLFVSGTHAAEKPIDGNELRRLLNPSEQEHYQHSRELKSDQMHLLLKKRPGKPVSGGGQETSEKKGRHAPNASADPSSESPPAENTDGKGAKAPAPAPAAGTDGKENMASTGVGAPPNSNTASPGSAAKTAKPVNDPGRPDRSRRERKNDRYIPPSWKASPTAGKMSVGGFQSVRSEKRKGPYFGIRLGTKIRARLPQVTTNVEQNLTEITITQDVYGDFKVLPRGSTLFAKKSLNPASKRLELLVVKGITPAPRSEEFSIKGFVMDINNTAGLVGAVSTDGKAAQRSFAAGAFGVGKELAPMLNNGTLVGAGVEAAAENMLDEKETQIDKTLNEPSYIIYVNPQEIKIRIEETF